MLCKTHKIFDYGYKFALSFLFFHPNWDSLNAHHQRYEMALSSVIIICKTEKSAKTHTHTERSFTVHQRNLHLFNEKYLWMKKEKWKCYFFHLKIIENKNMQISKY